MPKNSTVRTSRREREVRATHSPLTTYTGANGWRVECTCGARDKTLYATRDAAIDAHNGHRARLVGAR